MKSILDPSFRYRPSVATDIRATFVRVRREQRKQSPNPSAARSPLAVLPARRSAVS